ncbi:MAG TPA: AAA family ATPase, partial [Leptospiraceae bacterium]|nr:AAA family ATPase [Leptospiraceae bacterium]
MPHPLLKLIETASETLLGKRREIELAAAAWCAGGHILIEDIPGVGKTTLALLLAKLAGFEISRIQFTSDLLPADILGVSIYHHDKKEFEFRKGPIFSPVVLADELNRASPKTQSAFMQAMEEGAVTMDGIH